MERMKLLSAFVSNTQLVRISIHSVTLSTLLLGIVELGWKRPIIAQTSIEETLNQCYYLLNSGQPLPQETIAYCQELHNYYYQQIDSQLQQIQCVNQLQIMMYDALADISEAQIEESNCETAGCRDYWRIRENEAQEAFHNATSLSSQQPCLML